MNPRPWNNKNRLRTHPERSEKYGSFIRKSDGQKIQRYRCLDSGITYSSATFSEDKYLKKRHLIYFIGKLLSETQGQNSIARVLNVSSNTVVNYFMRFHKKALEYNNWFLESRRFGLIQFDELNTFEHTKLKPVHISLAVERTTRFILGTSVAIAPYSHEKDLALRKYGPREDERKIKVEELFHHLCPHITEKAWIQMDKCSWYERVLKSVLPDVQYQKYKGRKPIEYGFNELKRGWDPLFSINHTCAMLRAHINRLARKTWCTTKKPERLQMHLDIYMMFHNMLILEAMKKEESLILT